MVKEVGVALLGLGTVGSNVLKILLENKEYFEKEFNERINVYFVYVRNVYKKRDMDLEGITLTDKVEEIINSPQVDVCVECMGGSGTEVTYDIIMRLIKRRKHIIMSSKKCLALYKNEIVENVNKYNVQLRYDATVGGSIPICKVFQNLSGYDSINKIYGIANATTNYILSLMHDKGLDYHGALELAQKEGCAENDASDDVDGRDALYKMCILLRFGMGVDIVSDTIIPVGIEDPEGLSCEKNVSKIKQIFYAEKLKEDRIRVYVGPMVVGENSVLGSVEGKDNIFFAEHKYGGRRAYYGKGAGGMETASIMIEDLLDAIHNEVRIKPAEQYKDIEQMSRDEVKI